MTLRDDRGFTLMELMVVMIVLATVLAFSLPAYIDYLGSHNLKGAAEDIVGQLKIAREKAIATGTKQIMHFYTNQYNSDYHIHNTVAGVAVTTPGWYLPHGITYYNGAGFQPIYQMNPDGTCSNSGYIILQDVRSHRDTVSVQMSGLILHQ
jgi:prepilin-type N-terminal cleavage/methylation domain-containing protein